MVSQSPPRRSDTALLLTSIKLRHDVAFCRPYDAISTKISPRWGLNNDIAHWNGTSILLISIKCRHDVAFTDLLWRYLYQNIASLRLKIMTLPQGIFKNDEGVERACRSNTGYCKKRTGKIRNKVTCIAKLVKPGKFGWMRPESKNRILFLIKSCFYK